MLKLTRTAQEQHPEKLIHTLKSELESGVGVTLPLEKGTDEGGYCDGSNLQVTVLSLERDDGAIRAKVGVFFTEIVANCSCGDEPVEKPAYCEMRLTIDRDSAETVVHVI